MTIILKFKSIITTEETYPHAFILEFTKEMTIHADEYENENELSDIIFSEAHEFEKSVIGNNHLVDMTTNCLGITHIHNAKTSEILDLARLGIERL